MRPLPLLRHLTRRPLSTTARRRTTLRTLQHLHASQTPITMLTAYDYPTALHADRAGVDIVLVGDSLGMVVLGNRTTQSVTTAQMIHHSTAARRGVESALLIADLPFGSYEQSPAQAVQTAVEIIKESGVDAIKLEGGESRTPLIRAVVDAGIAVMGHVGLRPQMVSALGGFRAVGRTAEEAQTVVRDARAVAEAGAFAMVVECVPKRVAEVVTGCVDVPTIGIGSGNGCSGQVLVYHDMLGILSHPHHNRVAPKFSKAFAEVGRRIHEAIGDYCEQVREGTFPCEQFSPYRIGDEEFERFVREVGEGKGKKGGVGGEEGITVY